VTALDDARLALSKAQETVTTVQRVVDDLAAPPPPPPPLAARFGISTGYKILNRSSADQDFELDQIKAIGAQIVRLDYWEPAKADAVIAKCFARDLQVQLILGSTLRYPPPLSAADFGNRCRAAAQKYLGRVHYYEPINEPNGAWNGPWNPAAYVQYQKAFYEAVKTVDPAVVAYLGGIAPATTITPVAWVQALYANGAKPYFDAMNPHLYGEPTQTAAWSIWQQTFGPNVNPNIASVMRALGDTKPIVSTEGGGRIGTGFSELQQAGAVDRNLRDPRLAQSFIFCMLDDTDPGFGLLRGDRTKRPSWNAYRTAVSL
jgi:hypothetical protein